MLCRLEVSCVTCTTRDVNRPMWKVYVSEAFADSSWVRVKEARQLEAAFSSRSSRKPLGHAAVDDCLDDHSGGFSSPVLVDGFIDFL